ncbi:MAG TPA: HAMP domain-containing sensor histidine kinase [Candidatus Paceibacterota bacterium]|nr:HAMP domain-containing sensor histidine kinase [Candidatus Paceibacterota bacterium]
MSRDAERARLLSELAHEFQTPIAILKSSIEALAESGSAGANANAKRANAAYIAQATLDRLSRLVREFLDAAALKNQANAFRMAPIALSDLLSGVCEDCALLAEDKGVPLSCVSDVVSIAGDRDKLKQVFLNLISNALKHTGSGGSIAIAGKAVGRDVAITVADTGTGIAPEHLPRVFERFYRISTPGMPDAPEGNGIGLSLCRDIVMAHGGTIAVESEPGQGACFTVRLPALADQPQKSCYNQ